MKQVRGSSKSKSEYPRLPEGLVSRGRHERSSTYSFLFGLTRPSYSYSSGFTLIELLTVISIMGILTAVITVNLSSARRQARDVRRQTDLSTIQSALELYANANGGKVPTSSGQQKKSSDPQPWIPDSSGQLTSYVSNLPTDPTAGDATYYYVYQTNPSGCAAIGNPAADTMYALDATLEAANSANVNLAITAVPTDPCSTDFYKTGTYAVGKVVHYRVASGGR